MQIQSFPSGNATLNDLVVFQSVADGTYRKSSFNQLPGAVNDWQVISSNFMTEANKKVFNTATSNITLTLPVVTSGEIEIFNLNASSKIFVNLHLKTTMLR